MVVVDEADVLTISTRQSQIYNVKPSGAVGDDDAVAIQAAITAASAAGGGVVLVTAGTYAIATSIVLKTDVVVMLDPGATVKWTGAAGGVMFTTSTAVPTRRTGVIGGRIDPGAEGAGYVFDLHSPQESIFNPAEILTGSATLTVMRIITDVAAVTGGYENSANAVFNTVRLICSGRCGNVVVIQGASGAGVTLNQFPELECQNVQIRGVSIVKYADNNYFGRARFEVAGTNAIGVAFNDNASPAADTGVAANYFALLAVDTFVGPPFPTGRIGIKINASSRNVVACYFNDPPAEGGTIVDPGYATSYKICQAMQGGLMKESIKGHSFVNGVPGSAPEMAFDTNFTLTTSAGAQSFLVSPASGTVRTYGPVIVKFGVYATNETDQLVGNARRTGWTAATNTKTRTTFDTTTVTLPQLAARVGALLDDLIAHGLIGT